MQSFPIIVVLRLTIFLRSVRRIVVDPIGEDGKPQLGARKLVKGPTKFFLKPGESLEGNTVHDVYVLSAEEALYVRAREGFVDEGGKKRFAGDRWFVYGPREYWPSLEVDVVKSVPAFLKIEPLGLYYFQPVLFAIIAFLVLLGLYIFMKFNPLAASASHDEL
jgi:major vault protein